MSVSKDDELRAIITEKLRKISAADGYYDESTIDEWEQLIHAREEVKFMDTLSHLIPNYDGVGSIGYQENGILYSVDSLLMGDVQLQSQLKENKETK